MDESVFDIQLVDQGGYDPMIENIKFTIIPEPVTLCMMGLDVLLLRQRRR